MRPILPLIAAAQRPPIPAEVCRCIRIRIVQNGGLVEIPALYNTARAS